MMGGKIKYAFFPTFLLQLSPRFAILLGVEGREVPETNRKETENVHDH